MMYNRGIELPFTVPKTRKGCMQNGVAHLMVHYTPDTQIPYGYCRCGCGQKTNLAKYTDKRFGHVKGEPVRFLSGHVARIQPPSDHVALYWAKVAITADDELCWEWQGGCDSSGYGSKVWGDKTISAHRLSWMLNRGNIPDDLFVLHSCDNRKCVNPKHLFLGTHQDNMEDMKSKHRQYNGGGVFG